RNRCGSRGGCLPSVVPPRRLPRLRSCSRARCRRDQFVSGVVHAFGRVLVIPDVTIPRPFGARVSVIRRLTAFAAVSARESWAVTGRFREKYLSRLTGPARRYEVAYVPSHSV